MDIAKHLQDDQNRQRDKERQWQQEQVRRQEEQEEKRNQREQNRERANRHDKYLLVAFACLLTPFAALLNGLVARYMPSQQPPPSHHSSPPETKQEKQHSDGE